jgi:hypothetical protein
VRERLVADPAERVPFEVECLEWMDIVVVLQRRGSNFLSSNQGPRVPIHVDRLTGRKYSVMPNESRPTVHSEPLRHVMYVSQAAKFSSSSGALPGAPRAISVRCDLRHSSVGTDTRHLVHPIIDLSEVHVACSHTTICYRIPCVSPEN